MRSIGVLVLPVLLAVLIPGAVYAACPPGVVDYGGFCWVQSAAHQTTHADACSAFGLTETAQIVSLVWDETALSTVSTGFGDTSIGVYACCANSMWCNNSTSQCGTHNYHASEYYNWGPYADANWWPVYTCNSIALDSELVVTKTTSPTELSAGENVTWTVTVTNEGPGDAFAVSLTDDLPDGTLFLSATPSQGTCEETGGVLTCDLGTIVVDGSVTVEIEAQVRTTGEVINEVSVSGNSGLATGSATAPAVSSASTDVPVDDPWMLAGLTLLLALAGWVAVRR